MAIQVYNATGKAFPVLLSNGARVMVPVGKPLELDSVFQISVEMRNLERSGKLILRGTHTASPGPASAEDEEAVKITDSGADPEVKVILPAPPNQEEAPKTPDVPPQSPVAPPEPSVPTPEPPPSAEPPKGVTAEDEDRETIKAAMLNMVKRGKDLGTDGKPNVPVLQKIIKGHLNVLKLTAALRDELWDAINADKGA